MVIVKSPERRRRKIELLKLLAAQSDFGGAKHAAAMLLEHAPGLGSDLNYPLVVASIVCYSRPFTDNKPYGMLPGRYTRALPEPLRSIHDEVTTARDELFAHSDLDVRQAYIFPAGALIARQPREVRAAGLGCALSSRLYSPAFMAGLHDASTLLLGAVKTDIDALLEELYGGMDLPASKFKLRINNGL